MTPSSAALYPIAPAGASAPRARPGAANEVWLLTAR